MPYHDNRCYVELQLARRQLNGGESGLEAIYELVEDAKDVPTRVLDAQPTFPGTLPSAICTSQSYGLKHFAKLWRHLDCRFVRLIIVTIHQSHLNASNSDMIHRNNRRVQ